MPEKIRKIVADVEAGRVFSSDFGPMLVALQELAKAQRPSDFSLAAKMFIEGVPASQSYLRNHALQALIAHDARFHSTGLEGFLRWEKSHPEWRETLLSALHEPEVFEFRVNDLLQQLEEHRAVN